MDTILSKPLKTSNKRFNRNDKLFIPLIFITSILFSALFLSNINLQNQNNNSNNDNITITGHLEIYKDGILVVDKKNVITNVLLNLMRDEIHNSSYTDDNKFEYIAIGNLTGGGATSTTLENELNRTIGVFSKPGNYQSKLGALFTFSEQQNITESGVFNDSSNGILFNYQSFLQISCGTTTQLQVYWTFTYSSG